MRIRLFDPATHPRFDDLPWATPLADWHDDRLIELPIGLHRHVVRFVEYGGQFYALKELPQRLAEREFRLLRTMNDRALPVVAAVALVDRREPHDAVLITRFLHYALPFRYLFRTPPSDDVAGVLVESLSILLARLHTAGFLWGDCSLSNSLFRRDERELFAYALDTETGELHDALTDGQRRYDLDTAVVNIAGGLCDLAAAGELPDDVDPFDVAYALEARYTEVWDELNGPSLYDAQDPRALEERLERLYDLGFDVREAVITDSAEPGTFVFRPERIADGHYGRILYRCTGVTARERQAERLVEHIHELRSHMENARGTSVSLDDAGHSWLIDVYNPVMAAVPADVAVKLERPQLFLEVLDHHLAAGGSAMDRDGLTRSARRYADDVLAGRPQEKAVGLDA